MAAVRVLNDGRLALADGTRLDLDREWLTQADARIAAGAADLVVVSDQLSSTDISREPATIERLLAEVSASGRPVGARRYRGSNRLALVLTRSH